MDASNASSASSKAASEGGGICPLHKRRRARTKACLCACGQEVGKKMKKGVK